MPPRKVFVDTNIVIDLLQRRVPFHEDAERLFSAADLGMVELWLSTLTFADTHFVLSKSVGGKKVAISSLLKLRQLVSVVDLKAAALDKALNDKDFTDFEDALQHQCAQDCGAEVIITRNLKDFKRSTIPTVTAGEFLNTL
jgi:predicted nucleic acid-binding protein